MGAFRNIAATMIGTRIATETKSAGLFGVIAGLAATRVMARSPIGALVVGGGYIAHKLLQKKLKIDSVGPHDAAVADGLVDGQSDVAALPAAKPAPGRNATPAKKARAIPPAAENATLTEGP